MEDLREEWAKLMAKINMLWNKADVELPSICESIDRALSKHVPDAPPVKAPTPPPPKCFECVDFGFVPINQCRIRICRCEAGQKLINEALGEEES